MPNRNIRESIYSSDVIETLTPEEERCYYRLWPACDDFGRFHADIDLIIGRCYPKKRKYIDDDEVEEWLQGLHEKGAIQLYTVDGMRYLQVIDWHRDQQVRAKTSKFPDPTRLAPPVTKAAAAVVQIAEAPTTKLLVASPIQDVVVEDDPPTTDPVIDVDIRHTYDYRRFEAECRNGSLESWLVHTAFSQLVASAMSISGRKWQILIPIAKEAALSATGKPPNVYWAKVVMGNLPITLLTEADVTAHFEAKRTRASPSGGPGGPDEDVRERLRRERAEPVVTYGPT